MTIETISNARIQIVYNALKERRIDPEGTFDSGRWYPSDAESVGLDGIRSPSRRWPYSYMKACRTSKHVKALAEYSPELFAKHEAAIVQSDKAIADWKASNLD